MSIPGGSRPRFWAAYRDVDPDLGRRAAGWAVLFSLMLLEIGLEGRPSYADVGRRSLDELVPAAERLGL